MKPIAVAFVAVLAIALAPACAWVDKVDPTIKPLPGHLCSEVEVVCYTGTKETGCCPHVATCCGQDNPHCPAGMCEDIGMYSGTQPEHRLRPQRSYVLGGP